MPLLLVGVAFSIFPWVLKSPEVQQSVANNACSSFAVGISSWFLSSSMVSVGLEHVDMRKDKERAQTEVSIIKSTGMFVGPNQGKSEFSSNASVLACVLPSLVVSLFLSFQWNGHRVPEDVVSLSLSTTFVRSYQPPDVLDSAQLLHDSLETLLNLVDLHGKTPPLLSSSKSSLVALVFWPGSHTTSGAFTESWFDCRQSFGL